MHWVLFEKVCKMKGLRSVKRSTVNTLTWKKNDFDSTQIKEKKEKLTAQGGKFLLQEQKKTPHLQKWATRYSAAATQGSKHLRSARFALSGGDAAVNPTRLSDAEPTCSLVESNFKCYTGAELARATRNLPPQENALNAAPRGRTFTRRQTLMCGR